MNDFVSRSQKTFSTSSKGMSFLNIDSLSKGNCNNQPPSSLSVDSLRKNLFISATPEPKKRLRNRFDPKNLINTQDRIQKQINDLHAEVINLCFDMIHDANRLRNMDMVFEIPISFKGTPVLEVNTCAKKLISQVRDNYMDATRISDRHIFITWINIRSNMRRRSDGRR